MPDPWQPPKELLEPDLLEQTITWYCRLQPLERGSSWPLVRADSPRDWDWKALKKGGSGGIYLLLVAISWIPICGAQDDQKFKDLISDVKWVLAVLTELIILPMAPKKGNKRAIEENGSVTRKRQKKQK